MQRLSKLRTVQSAARVAQRTFSSKAAPASTAAAGESVPIVTVRGKVELRNREEVESLLGEVNHAEDLLQDAITKEYVETLKADFLAVAKRAEEDVMSQVRANPLLKGTMEYETIGTAPLRLGRQVLAEKLSGSRAQLEKDLSTLHLQAGDVFTGVTPVEEQGLSLQKPAAKAVSSSAVLGVTDAEIDALLDFNHPPRLTYEHVKMLKNIDYSSLVAAGREGTGMFTVSDVLPLIQTSEESVKRLTDVGADVRQKPFTVEDTFDTMASTLKKCRFCRRDPTEDRVNNIHYTNVDLIRQFINEAGMILPRRLTGLCPSHQRRMRMAIKNARFLALLSFTSDWHVPYSYVNPAQFPAHADQMLARDQDAARRMQRKQEDLETLAAIPDMAERVAHTQQILARKGVKAGFRPEMEARLAHLMPLPNQLPAGMPFADRFAPVNARAPLPAKEHATIGDIIARDSNAAYDWLDATAALAAAEAQVEDANGGLWAEDEADAAALRDLFGDDAPADATRTPEAAQAAATALGNASGYVSDGELEFLREAAATEQDAARAAGYRDFLVSHLRVRLAQTLHRGDAAELREELRQLLGAREADALPDATGFTGALLAEEAKDGSLDAVAAAAARELRVPSAEEVLRDLGVDVEALAARDGDGFDAAAWVEKLRQIQAANKLRDMRNLFDQGERLDDLKALHRMGFTGAAKKL